MSNFHCIVSEFTRLTSLYGFKPLKKLWYANLIAFGKHLEGDFYCYVIARRYVHNEAIETTLWVGPIDRPDDGLDSLSAHIKLTIGYEQIANESFFLSCESKIINLINTGVLNSLLKLSQQELLCPSNINERHKVYSQYFLPLYRILINKANGNKHKLRHKKEFRLIFEMVYPDLDDNISFFCEDIGLSNIEKMLWAMCYIYAIT